MAKKSIKKKKTVKNTSAAKAAQESAPTPLPKKTVERENNQLMWFFLVVLVAFAVVLIPYFYNESTKTFEYKTIDWTIEKAGKVTIFHGRFPTLNGQRHIAAGTLVHHNIFLRNDPRENIVLVEGPLDDFKNGGVVSISPEFDTCRGDIPRIMVDFFDFLSNGIGMMQLEAATPSAIVANETGKRQIDCSYTGPETVFLFDLGKEDSIVVNSENPNCYQITASSCQSTFAIERFMVQSVADFRAKYGEITLAE